MKMARGWLNKSTFEHEGPVGPGLGRLVEFQLGVPAAKGWQRRGVVGAIGLEEARMIEMMRRVKNSDDSAIG